MSAASQPTHAQSAQGGPSVMVSFSVAYRLFLAGQLSRLRALGLLSLGIVGIILAAITRTTDDVVAEATTLMADYGLAVVAPVCTLWIATSLIGDLVEDRLLAYLWLKPVRSWVLPAAAIAATCTIMIPLVVVPLTIAAAATGVSELILPTAGAALLAVLGYSGLFVTAGARFSKALWWGLLYVLVWENAVARISDGTALLAVRSYTVSILSRATDTDLYLADRSPAASVLVPIGLAITGVVVSAWILRTRDID